MTASPPTAPGEATPHTPPPLGLVGGMALVTRYRLRLADPSDSRLGPLGGETYDLAAASWTGPRVAFVGFYTPPSSGVAEDLRRRVRSAEAWAAGRLSQQGAAQAAVLLVALGPVPERVATGAGTVRIGAVAVAPDGSVTVLAPPPRGLPGAGEVRGWARAVRDGRSVPTLAAVDLAERQTVAGGYVAPIRTAQAQTPYATWSLVALWVAIMMVEVAVHGRLRLGRIVTEFDMGALPPDGPGSTDWWRYVSSAFLHDHGSLLHILGNGLFMVVVGSQVERLYGRLALLGVWLISAVAANVLWVLALHVTGSGGVSFGLGASGGNFGLLGLILVLGRVQGRDVAAGVAGQLRQYAVTLAALNIVVGFTLPHVNNVVHLFGFLSGAALGLWIPPTEAIGGRSLRRAEQAVILVALAVAGVALVIAGAHLADVLSGPETAPLAGTLASG